MLYGRAVHRFAQKRDDLFWLHEWFLQIAPEAQHRQQAEQLPFPLRAGCAPTVVRSMMRKSSRKTYKIFPWRKSSLTTGVKIFW